MEGGEGEKPDLELVHSSKDVEPVSEEDENEAFIRRQLTKKTSKLTADQERAIWAHREEGDLEKAQIASGFSPEEFKRLFDEANRILYGEPQASKASDKPGHPSRSGKPKKEPPPTDEGNVIPFRTPPEEPPQP